MAIADPWVAPPEPVTLVDDDLVLRAFSPDDVPAVQRAFINPDIGQWNPGPAGADPEGTARAWIARRADWAGGDHASWAVSNPDGHLLGSVSLFCINAEQAVAEAGYWIVPEARGRRLGAAALVLAVTFAFTTLRLHRVYLHHAIENTPSCRVAAAAGFRLEGHLRQSFRYPDGNYHDEHLHARLATDGAGSAAG